MTFGWSCGLRCSLMGSDMTVGEYPREHRTNDQKLVSWYPARHSMVGNWWHGNDWVAAIIVGWYNNSGDLCANMQAAWAFNRLIQALIMDILEMAPSSVRLDNYGQLACVCAEHVGPWLHLWPRGNPDHHALHRPRGFRSCSHQEGPWDRRLIRCPARWSHPARHPWLVKPCASGSGGLCETWRWLLWSQYSRYEELKININRPWIWCFMISDSKLKCV